MINGLNISNLIVIDLQYCKDTLRQTHIVLNGPPAMNAHVCRCLTTNFNTAIYKKKNKRVYKFSLVYIVLYHDHLMPYCRVLSTLGLKRIQFTEKKRKYNI